MDNTRLGALTFIVLESTTVTVLAVNWVIIWMNFEPCSLCQLVCPPGSTDVPLPTMQQLLRHQ